MEVLGLWAVGTAEQLASLHLQQGTDQKSILQSGVFATCFCTQKIKECWCVARINWASRIASPGSLVKLS